MTDENNEHKKHGCSDCGYCQWCGDDRCGLCLKRTPTKGRKLSQQEQIALYEAVNSRE